MMLGQYLSENLRQFFFPIRKVLENHDLGKTSLPPKRFWAGTPMFIRKLVLQCWQLHGNYAC